MLALVAGLCFFVGLLLDWSSSSGGTVFNTGTLTLLGLLFLALHLAGVGTAYDWRGRARTYYRRRR